MKQTIRNIFYIASALYMMGCGKNEAETISESSILIEVEAPRTNGWSSEENVGTRCDQTIKEEGKDGLDIEVSTQPGSDTPTGQVTTRWTNLDDGIIFRVIAYKCASASNITTANYAGYGDYKLSGTTVQATKNLVLPIGTYTFVCYSYGNSTAIPAFNNSTTSVSATNGQNFMTCVKPNITINITGSKYTLSNIVFTHKCVQYRILAKAQSGRMGNITACSGTLTLPNNSATYSFTNDAFTTNKVAGNLNVSWNNSNAMTAYSNYVYILPVSSQNITMSLNPTIGGKAFSGKSTTLSSLTFSKNKTYYSTISFTTTQGYIVGGAFWANGNLYYKSSYGIYPQMYTYTVGKTGGDFWDWNTTAPYPTKTSRTTWDNNYDPCRKVSPANTWRTPTYDEASKLINSYTWSETTISGIKGLLCAGIIFFPYTGYISAFDDSYGDNGSRGLYYTTHPSSYINIQIDMNIMNGNNNIDNCMAIRCVRNL